MRNRKVANSGERLVQPLRDQVLIRRIEEESLITLTDRPKSIKGVILAIGPGKWIPGKWRSVLKKKNYLLDQKTLEPINPEYERKWRNGYRRPLDVRPGMCVLFNSKWNDFSASENRGTGCDGKGPLERPLPQGADPMLHLVQEADIFGIVPDFNFQARLLPTLQERELMQNIEIKGPWNG